MHFRRLGTGRQYSRKGQSGPSLVVGRVARQAAARAAGKVWGGGKPGRRVRLSSEKEQAILQRRNEGRSIAEIARVVGLSRPTIYRALG